MARVVMFAYVLLAGLATPALILAAGGDAAPSAATGAQANDPAAVTTTTTASTPAPAPSPAPAPAPASPAAPAAAGAAAPASGPSTTPAPAARAHPKRASVLAARRPVKLRAVAHTAGSDTISDFKFTPGTVTVSVGESVTWTNDGPAGHSATADDGSFDTGVLRRGTSGSHTFTTAGTYTFHCTPHPFMHGTIVVRAASSGGGGGGSAASGSSSSGSASGSSDTGTGSSSGSGTGSGGSAGSNLPNTGADVGAVALLGAILLGGGTMLRRRLRDHA